MRTSGGIHKRVWRHMFMSIVKRHLFRPPATLVHAFTSTCTCAPCMRVAWRQKAVAACDFLSMRMCTAQLVSGANVSAWSAFFSCLVTAVGPPSALMRFHHALMSHQAQTSASQCADVAVIIPCIVLSDSSIHSILKEIFCLHLNGYTGITIFCVILFN